MSHGVRYRPRPLRCCLLAVCALALLAAGAGPAFAARGQESMFQDDSLLVFRSPAEVGRTLDGLRYLGVDRVRVTVLWKDLAPQPAAGRPPAVNTGDPAVYSAAGWARYDTLVRLAAIRRIGVNFNVSGPVPTWAAGLSSYPPFTGHYQPSALEFGRFVEALGRRYSGTYRGADGGLVPRVSYWSIWNEPNGIHFLAPVWQRSRGQWVERSAVMYRGLLDAAWSALSRTGHTPGTDTILVGETSPQAKAQPAPSRSARPLRFIRALYCVGANLRALRGTAAEVRGCPARPGGAAFRAAHPALFLATGFAHHPYELVFAPTTPSQVDAVSTADLPRLTSTLDGIFRRYGSGRRLPIYNTEFGYESRPPNPIGVSFLRQAEYLNEAEFLSYRNPRVASFSQFLLGDYPNAELFHTGLVQSNGALKPAYGAYRTPIWIPRTFSPSGRFRVWGLLRSGQRSGVRSAVIQFARAGRPFATLANASAASARGYVDRNVSAPASGRIRIGWRDPATGATTYSRAIAVSR